MCYCLWLGSGICPPRTIPLGPLVLLCCLPDDITKIHNPFRLYKCFWIYFRRKYHIYFFSIGVLEYYRIFVHEAYDRVCFKLTIWPTDYTPSEARPSLFLKHFEVFLQTFSYSTINAKKPWKCLRVWSVGQMVSFFYAPTSDLNRIFNYIYNNIIYIIKVVF